MAKRTHVKKSKLDRLLKRDCKQEEDKVLDNCGIRFPLFLNS